MLKLTGTLHEIQRISGAVSGSGRVSGQISRPQTVQVEKYTGPYSFTPSEAEQVIDIAYKQAISDIVVDPIPQNYGRITWNGSVLTVS